MLLRYKVPNEINSFYNFGFHSGIFFGFQICSGVFLTFFYCAHVEYSYSSVMVIMREINYGWFIRFLHLNGASLFFFLVYCHMGRGLYYKSFTYPRYVVWKIGVVIYLFMMGTAFLGYVLPWGQMSYWAATVITNMLTAIPVVGKNITYIVWGGYAINDMTLTRFYSLHYLLPFIILILAFLHISILHKSRSSSVLGVYNYKTVDSLDFGPFFLVKDLCNFLIFVFIFFLIIDFNPELLNHSDNYIEANPMVTPPHIVPEIYFLPFYGVLKTISHKILGIFFMFFSIAILFFMPFFSCNVRKARDNTSNSLNFFLIFLFNFLFLGYIGSESPNYPWLNLGIIANHLYFLLFHLYSSESLAYLPFNSNLLYHRVRSTFELEHRTLRRYLVNATNPELGINLKQPVSAISQEHSLLFSGVHFVEEEDNLNKMIFSKQKAQKVVQHYAKSNLTRNNYLNTNITLRADSVKSNRYF
jgi:ubiquinol-cytochrome c reductase cytochrome b subunit